MSQYGIENSYGIMLLGDTFALFDEVQEEIQSLEDLGKKLHTSMSLVSPLNHCFVNLNCKYSKEREAGMSDSMATCCEGICTNA